MPSGEVVFTTAMTGYQECLTDPSFAGQILVMTYPLIGNYGTNEVDIESNRIQVRAFVVREACEQPSHWLSTGTISEYLERNGIVAISGLDTRALTRRLRSSGVMMGMVTTVDSPEAALALLREAPAYGSQHYVEQVSAPSAITWGDESGGTKLALLDLGVKYNIPRLLAKRGLQRNHLPLRRAGG